jgi:aryl-alcohol dehydrogenase-like predicted oxidoreductase
MANYERMLSVRATHQQLQGMPAVARRGRRPTSGLARARPGATRPGGDLAGTTGARGAYFNHTSPRQVPGMTPRPLGRSGLSVPPIVFGGNVFGWTVDRAQSFRLLDACVEAGLNAIDTADVYSRWHPGNQGGESETIIGEWLKARGRRHDVLILTKCGMEMPAGKGLSAAWIARAADDSLKRLNTDVIVLYQAHRDDETVPLEETLGAFAELIRAGKVRAIGASNYSADRLAQALAVSARENLPRFESHQPLYNLMERGIEADQLPLCASEQVGVIPYSALASGFLSGKYRGEADLTKSVRGPRSAAKYLTPRGHAVLDALHTVAARLNASSAQVALAWMLARPGITAPIASATTLDQLRDLQAAATLALDAEDVAALDAASRV